VDVRLATEEPDHVWHFDLPDTPDAVFADVMVLIIGEVDLIEAAGLEYFMDSSASSLRKGASISLSTVWTRLSDRR